MSQPKVTQSKTPKLKVMHYVSKDGNGQPTITSKTVKQGTTKPKTETKDAKPLAPATPKANLTDEQVAIMKALYDLGGKDVHSMDIAKKLGFDKKYPDAPRAPVRSAMGKLHSLHFVTSKKEGIRFSYSITDKGLQRLKDKGAHVEAPASPVSSSSSGSTQPPGIECPKCHAINPFNAEHCKECGTLLRDRAETVLKAAQVAA